MKIEIPPINIVTAIINPTREDFLAQTLFQYGWNILFRALDVDSLNTFLSQELPKNFLVNNEVVILYEPVTIEVNKILLPNIPEINFRIFSEKDLPFDREGIIEFLRTEIVDQGHCRNKQLESRPALIQSNVNRFSIQRKTNQSFQKIVTITGTEHSIGKSTICALLGKQINQSNSVLFVDADIEKRSLNSLINQEDSNRSRTLGRNFKENKIKILELMGEEKFSDLELDSSSIFIDLGSLPNIQNISHDRRWRGNFIYQTLAASSEILFCANSSDLSLNLLEEFADQIGNFEFVRKINFIFNEYGNKSNFRNSSKRFHNLTSQFPAFNFPRMDEIENKYPLPLRIRSSSKKPLSQIIEMLG